VVFVAAVTSPPDPGRRPAGRHQLDRGQGAKLVAKVVGCDADQRVDLVDRLGAGLAGADLRNAQNTNGLHVAVTGLSGTVRSPAERGPCSADCVDRVGLARQSTLLPVRSVHFDHSDIRRVQVAGQSSAIAAGALDPDQDDLPERGHPLQQLAIAGQRGRERRRPEHCTELVDRSGDMHVEVRIDTAGDPCHRFHVSLHPSRGTVDTAPAGTADKTATGLVSAGS
jgi:hypothetical protein